MYMKFVCALGILGVFMGQFAHMSYAAESIPGDVCSTENATRVAGGVETSGVLYYMVCKSGTWTRVIQGDASGNIVAEGEIVVGTSTGLACGASTAGAIRYNSTEDYLEFCGGSSWAPIGATTCSDTTPSSYVITDLVNQSTSTLVTSAITAVSGLGCAVNVFVSGEGTPAYRTCSDSSCSTVVQDWTTSSGWISDGEYIQTRLTTSSIGGDTYSATVIIGSVSQMWEVTTTGDCSGSPAVGTVCVDGTVYAGDTPDGNVAMYVTRCDAGMSWDGSECTGSRLGYTWNDGEDDWVETGVDNTITGQANSAALVITDSNSVIAGTQDHVAAAYCEDLTQDSYSDWYLPAKEDVNVIYGNRGVIDNLVADYYWSSTENTHSLAWRLNFSNGSWDSLYGSKRVGNYVRCARHD